LVPPHAARKKRRYCSKACVSKAKAVKRRRYFKCRQCRKTVPVRIGSCVRKDYCSRACKGRAKRTENFDKRRDPRCAAWAKRIIARDQRCVQCLRDDIGLHAHHIKSYADYPRIRYKDSNGRTLCVECHAEEHPNLAHLIRSNRPSPCYIKICVVCFQKYTTKRQDQILCSTKCMGISQRKPVDAATCQQCLKEFHPRKLSESKKRKFCSRTCFYKDNPLRRLPMKREVVQTEKV
jgi:hypothetical protein